jgi:hypothetical protein
MLFVKVNLTNSDIICRTKETPILLYMPYQIFTRLTWYMTHPSSMAFMIKEKMY